MSKHKRRMTSRRHRAHVKLLKQAVKGRHSKCHYCTRGLVAVRTIPVDRRIKVTAEKVIWIDDDGTERSDLILTCDHLRSVTEENSNGIGNLVPSCFACNHQRGKGQTPDRRPCAKCSVVTRVKKHHQGMCPKCERITRQVEFLAEHGWEMTEDRRYRDPATGHTHCLDWSIWFFRKQGLHPKK